MACPALSHRVGIVVRMRATDSSYHGLEADQLARLRDQHPGWRLLRYEHAPLVVSLFHRVFIVPNVRHIGQSQLVEALDDDLLARRDPTEGPLTARTALAYLTEWASSERGWLRRFYLEGDDQPAFDLTPEAEQAVRWVARVANRPSVATESRLRVLVELLSQMARSVETDPDLRIADLERRRDEIDAEIAAIAGGRVETIDPRQLREQFQQFVDLAGELLGDFRNVEQNFRTLDREVRERIAGWDGSKGELIGNILDEHDLISSSDAGRSFRAFWELLVAPGRQDELTANLAQVLGQPAMSEFAKDRRMRRFHHEWHSAAEHTQATVAQLTRQLRRFVDDNTWLDDRRIMELLRRVETGAFDVRDEAPDGIFFTIGVPGADTALPLERPLATLKRPTIVTDVDDWEDSVVDISTLFELDLVDVERLAGHIDRMLFEMGQVTLRDLCAAMPIEHGLAEIVTYLHLGTDRFSSTTDETVTDTIIWLGEGGERAARLPRVVFVR